MKIAGFVAMAIGVLMIIAGLVLWYTKNKPTMFTISLLSCIPFFAALAFIGYDNRNCPIERKHRMVIEIKATPSVTQEGDSTIIYEIIR